MKRIAITVLACILMAFAAHKSEPKDKVLFSITDVGGKLEVRHYGISEDSACGLLEMSRNLYCDPFDVSPKHLK